MTKINGNSMADSEERVFGIGSSLAHSYLPEEYPKGLAHAILDFWQSNPTKSPSQTEAH